MADRLGRRPVWLTDDPSVVDPDDLLATSDVVEKVDVAPFREQWFDLARILTEVGRRMSDTIAVLGGSSPLVPYLLQHLSPRGSGHAGLRGRALRAR